MADEQMIINTDDRVQEHGRTSRPNAASTLHNALADNVCPPVTAAAVKHEPPDVNNDVCSTDDIVNVTDEVSNVSNSIRLEIDAAVKIEPLDVNDDAGNVNIKGSRIWIEACPLDMAATVKQEVNIRATMLQSPDIKYEIRPCKLDSEDYVLQMESHRLGKDNVNIIQPHLLTHTGEDNYDICNTDFLHKLPFSKKNISDNTNETSHFYDSGSTNLLEKITSKSHNMLTGEQPHSCCVCKKNFSGKSILNRHMFTHTGERPYGCDICNKSFSEKSSLKKHMLTHTGERAHRCDVCNKTFSEKSNLKSHMLNHTGERPHHCEVCYKNFQKRSDLKRHMLTHTGEKPHHCDICNKNFSDKSNLKRHQLIHTGERPHRCVICNKGFSLPASLDSHMLSHT